MGRNWEEPLPNSARVSAEQIRRASLTVANRATSADDCRNLLEMLGLMPLKKDAA
jgi:hypothetical protein